MAHCFKLRTKKSYCKVPKGFEIQVVTNQSSMPTTTELKEALMKAGFNAAESSMFGSTDFEILSKS